MEDHDNRKPETNAQKNVKNSRGLGHAQNK
jgi:hypothetical protein